MGPDCFSTLSGMPVPKRRALRVPGGIRRDVLNRYSERHSRSLLQGTLRYFWYKKAGLQPAFLIVSLFGRNIYKLLTVAHNAQQHQKQVDEIKVQRQCSEDGAFANDPCFDVSRLGKGHVL